VTPKNLLENDPCASRNRSPEQQALDRLSQWTFHNKLGYHSRADSRAMKDTAGRARPMVGPMP